MTNVSSGDSRAETMPSTASCNGSIGTANMEDGSGSSTSVKSAPVAESCAEFDGGLTCDSAAAVVLSTTETQVLQSIDTNAMEEALLKAAVGVVAAVTAVKPPTSSSSSSAPVNAVCPTSAEKENSSLTAVLDANAAAEPLSDSRMAEVLGQPSVETCSAVIANEADPAPESAPDSRMDERIDQPSIMPQEEDLRLAFQPVPQKDAQPTASVPLRETIVVVEPSLEVCKECVRAYAEFEEPLEICPQTFNPHGLNLEHIALPELGLCLRADEENPTVTEPLKLDNDWILEENIAPVRASTAKRFWRQVDESGFTNLLPAVNGEDSNVVALKKRCVESCSVENSLASERIIITAGDFVWERCQPGFSGEDFLKNCSPATVDCANSVKKKYEMFYRRRRPRTIAGKINGLTKLAGGRPSKKSANGNLTRSLPSDGFEFGRRKNKVLAAAAEILGEVATSASEDDAVKADDEEMLSAGSEVMLDESESRRKEAEGVHDGDEEKEPTAPVWTARESGGAAAVSQASSALTKVGSTTTSIQGVSLSSFPSKGYAGSQGSVRQLTLVELARLQGVVQKGAYGRPRGLRPSLFSNVPPTINFALHNTHAEEVPPFLKKHLRWKLSNLTPLVVRKVLGHSNLRLMKSDSTEWIGHWGRHMKAVMFKDFKAYQKINHFPGTFVIGRKDRLWRGFAQFRSKFGKNEFNFLPRTFILPNDLRELKESMDRKGSRGQNYIVKPPASARGTGVYVVNNYSSINAERSLVVQKYITRPFLINGTKFDLRLYIFVASYNPLRLYLYRDGLVRFASEKYNSSSRTLNHQFVHLTNYSINRKSGNYQANNSINECQGHKWTLLAFWKFLRRLGVNTGLLWASIQDIVIKTILTSEATVNDMMERHVRSRYSTFELFGFDIILDETLKPWLLEVNISPSLHSTSALDEDVKGRMLRDLFNVMMLHVPSGKLTRDEEREVVKQCRLPPDSAVVHDPVLYTDELSRTERNKHDYYQTKNRRKDYLRTILSELTPDDIRQLIIAEDEVARCGDYVRIFPTQYTYLYHRFFEKPRYYNLLLDAWEFHYHSDRLAGRLLLEHYCSKKYHLQFRKDVSYRRIHVQSPLKETPTTAGSATTNADETESPSSSTNRESEDDVESRTETSPSEAA